MGRLKDEHVLYIRSMGKALRVTAIFRTNDEANAFMAKHDEQACVAVVSMGPGEADLILLADRYDPGLPIPRV